MVGYKVFDGFNKDTLEEVCRLFEQNTAGGYYCPLGRLLLELDVDSGSRPSAYDFASAMTTRGGAGLDNAYYRRQLVLSGRFMRAWDAGRVDSTTLRAAMGLPAR